jgi:hypothetical protein
MHHWLNFHIYYHADRDRLLCEAVSPLLANLYKEGLLARFYFVRYSLGGPHIRLRLETARHTTSLVGKAVEAYLENYFRMAPSLQSLSKDEIGKTTRMLIASDPNEHDETIHPDNCILQFPFAPEIDRYGGAELMTFSLDLFNFTSVEALTLTGRRRYESRSQAFSASIRALLRLSLAFAEEHAALADFWQKADLASVASGPELQARQRLVQLLREESARTPDDEEWKLWSAAGNSLRQKLSAAPKTISRGIMRSHLHMFANRLDISNAVENGMDTLLSGIFKEREPAWTIPQAAAVPDWLAESCRRALWLQASFATAPRVTHR